MALINAVITVDLASLQWKGTYKINSGGSHGFPPFVSSHLLPTLHFFPYKPTPVLFSILCAPPKKHKKQHFHFFSLVMVKEYSSILFFFSSVLFEIKSKDTNQTKTTGCRRESVCVWNERTEWWNSYNLTWAAPSGGTLNLFMALWRSPPSSSVVTRVYTHKHQWFKVCARVVSRHAHYVRSCTSERAPRSPRWAAWSSCRCRKAPPPREPRASRPREKYPGFCHASSGFYGNRWSSGSVDSNKRAALITSQTSRMEELFIRFKQSFIAKSFSWCGTVCVLKPGSSGAGWGWGRTRWRRASGPWCCGVCSAPPVTGETWSCVSAGRAGRCSRAARPVKTEAHFAAWQNVSGLQQASLQAEGQEESCVTMLKPECALLLPAC